MAVGPVAGALAQAPPTAGPPVPADTSAVADPCASVNQSAPSLGSPCDTAYTPQAKDSPAWTQVAGARYGEQTTINNITPYTVDFFSVRFNGSDEGYAGGAACAGPATAFADLAAKCDVPGGRVPALYHYSALPGEKPAWTEVPLPGGEGSTAPGDPARPGFIGAIAFTNDGKVLAVGGDGVYPRREPAPGQPELAGKARAWLYDGQSWQELDMQGQPAKNLVALNALDCAPVGSPDGSDCFAGGLRQLVRWHDGRFDQTYGPQDVDYPGDWLFRIREIKFWPTPNIPKGVPHVVAATAGCCYVDPTTGVEDKRLESPRVLGYDPTNPTAAGLVWRSRLLVDPAYNDGAIVGPDPFSDPTVAEQDRRTAGRSSLPDSYYAIVASPTAPPGPSVSVLATPGGPEPAVSSPVTEPASRIVGDAIPPTDWAGAGTRTTNPVFDAANLALYPAVYPSSSSPTGNTTGGELWNELLNPDTAPMRLVAGDGDLTGPPARAQNTYSEGIIAGPAGGPDGVMDWAVGSLTAGPAAGEGIAYTSTARSDPDAPNPLQCPADQPGLGCKPADSASLQRQVASQSLFALHTYALNAFTIVDSSGGGWAAGDKGALVQLGAGAGASGVAPEPSPPSVGAGSQTPLSDTSAYGAFRPPASTEPGTLPALSARPLIAGAPPQFVSGGAPDPTRTPQNGPQEAATALVMSRDGSEGWAIGPSVGGLLSGGVDTTLYHYLDGHWSRCDPEGIAGVRAADPACSSLAGLARHLGTGGVDPIRLEALGRVPTENDAGASPGGFEVVAIGSSVETPRSTARTYRLVARYRDGRWSEDKQAEAVIPYQGATVDNGTTVLHPGVAFVASDDGWISDGGGGLYHFDGQRWIDCTKSAAGVVLAAACGDSGRLPTTGDTFAVTSAGDRVYLYGSRSANAAANSTGNVAASSAPLILYQQRDASGALHPWSAEPGGDPKTDSPNGTDAGAVQRLSVVRNADGSYSGWATGSFGPAGQSPQTGLMALAGGKWSKWLGADAAADYLAPDPSPAHHPVGVGAPTPYSVEVVAVPGADGSRPPRAFAAPLGVLPMLGFDPGSGWRVLPAPFTQFTGASPDDANAARTQLAAIASDGGSGLWAIAQRAPITLIGLPANRQYYVYETFYHYTDQVHQPVFSDVAHPVREQITAAAGGGDGSLWVATSSSRAYRYDRVTGWEPLTVRGWNLGLGTAASPATAIAVGPGGRGVIVGEGGRIADLAPPGALLDPASGVRCADHPELAAIGPCGTGYSLRAVAVAPDGSAIAAGDDRALLWRSAGGAFHAIAPPPASPSATFTGVSLPTPDRAWLTTDTGQVFAGRLGGARWSWGPAEDLSPQGTLLSLDDTRRPLALTAIAIDASGDGYAVGDRGLILQRADDGAHPWQRVNAGYLDNLTAVTLGPGGKGALIGGYNGLLLTLQAGHFEVARPADPYDPIDNSLHPALDASVVGVALLGGERPGQLEAWAAEQLPPGRYGFSNPRSPAPGALLHYSSDPQDPLLDGGVGRVQPLPDTPAPRRGELSFAAFGKSDCQLFDQSKICPAITGTNLANEVIARRIADAIAAAAKQPGGPSFAVFTGDANNHAGQADVNALAASPTDNDLVHRRWNELIAGVLRDAGVPLYGALGGQDLSHAYTCGGPESGVGGGCSAGTTQTGKGTNTGWRQTFAAMPAPWGSGAAASRGSLSFEPAPGSAASTSNISVTNPADGSSVTTVPTGGADTHYALDIKRDGKALARLVVLDTSQGSLSASDPQQAPTEAQLTWLRSQLCTTGQTVTADCTRDPSEQAIVVSEAPAYSYGPGQNSDTLTDSAAVEAILRQYGVGVVVSGRLGWNGLYYTSTLAPGLHCPDAGGSYPDPSTGCSPTAGGSAQAQQAEEQGSTAAVGTLASVLSGTGAPAPPPPSAALQAYPTVIAASAGGKFGPADQTTTGSASQGYWHGYSIVRTEPDGSVIVEQRPVLDWIGITAIAHDLQPGQHVQLHGYGREPVGSDMPIQYDDISSAAITHRFDLVQADPAAPYLPKLDPSGHYVPVDPSIATIDRQTGFIQTGSGSHPRVYAIAILSVGDKAASWPIAFEPRRNFTSRPSILPQIPAVIPPAQMPPIHVAAAAPTPPPPPGSAPPYPPEAGTPTLPTLPNLSAPPPIAALPGPSAPPPPAPPPPPPAQPQPLPLALQAKLSPVGVNATVVPPSPPPVNPAPPSGSAAKKEAKQRQAATAKSEEGGSDAREAGVDLADSRPGGSDAAQMTRRDVPGRHAFTALAAREQPSAWSRDLAYGAGLALGSWLLALTWLVVGPTARRREPRVPAPQWNCHRRRRPDAGHR